jgi:hypothetical protein
MAKLAFVTIIYLLKFVFSLIALYYFAAFVGFALSLWGQPQPDLFITVLAFFVAGFINLLERVTEVPAFLKALSNLFAGLGAWLHRQAAIADAKGKADGGQRKQPE